MKEYLTEIGLKDFLEENFKGKFIHNKSIPNSKNKRFKPDFYSNEYMLILEFDGFYHYNNSKQIKRDFKKDIEYISLGYKIIRIPYFIQLSNNLIKTIFNIDINIKQIYKNGFIDDKALLPADFCELGIEKFKSNLVQFYYCKDEIIESLQNKIIKYNDIDVVLPKSLQYLVK
jgi:hypothetical protein